MTPSERTMLGRVLALPMMRWGKDEMRPLIDLLPDNAAVAEIGVFAGECSVQFLRSPKVASLLCVDPWAGGYDETGRDVAAGADMEAARFAFCERVWSTGQQRKCAVLRGTSFQAASGVAGRSFDLVYIDADHSVAAVRADIRAWQPLVKPGGLLAGHDYNPEAWPGVVRAVKQELGNPHAVYPDSSWMVRIK